MRRTALVLTYMSAALLVIAIACQKTESIQRNEEKKLVITKKGSIQFTTPVSKMIQDVTISSEGYLEIPTAGVLQVVKDYLTTHTHGQVKAFLYSEGFNSYGATIYGFSYNNQMVTADQAADYVVNTDRIVQIERVLYKPIGASECSNRDWDFVLAMELSELNYQSFELLRDGTYDGQYMHKLATDPESLELGSSRHIMDSVRTGIEQSESSCEGSTARRPMFGLAGGCCYQAGTQLNPQTGGYDPVYWACNNHYYFFWIMVDNNGGCLFTTGCQGYTSGSNCAHNAPQF